MPKRIFFLCAGDLSRWQDLDLLVQLGVASKQLRAL